MTALVASTLPNQGPGHALLTQCALLGATVRWMAAPHQTGAAHYALQASSKSKPTRRPARAALLASTAAPAPRSASSVRAASSRARAVARAVHRAPQETSAALALQRARHAPRGSGAVQGRRHARSVPSDSTRMRRAAALAWHARQADMVAARSRRNQRCTARRARLANSNQRPA
jgi:hypothetical protein